MVAPNDSNTFYFRYVKTSQIDFSFGSNEHI